MAAGSMEGSARQKGLLLARRGLSEVERTFDLDLDDIVALTQRLAAASSAIHALATDPLIDTAGLVRAARLARFEARGCRYLPESEWGAELRDISRAVRPTLARRYAEFLTAGAESCQKTVFSVTRLAEAGG